MGIDIHLCKDYASHIGIKDDEFKKVGVEIKNSSVEVLNSCNLLIRVNCPSEEEIQNLKEKTFVIGMLNPSQNKKKIDEMTKKNISVLSLELLPRITRAQSMDVLSSQSNLAGYRAVIESIFELKLTDEKKIIEESNSKFKEENDYLKIQINKLNDEIYSYKNEITSQKEKIDQFFIDQEELEFLRLNLLYSQKCQTRKLFSTGLKVGTPEYKRCILNRGKLND